MTSTDYELKLERFKGPMAALLSLIEERKMAVTEINLAEITEDFLKFLKDVQSSLPLLTDFISIASRLLLIKSKSLLPDIQLSQDEEEQIKDLQERLKLYQEIKPVMKLFNAAWRNPTHGFSRPYFWSIFSISSGWGVEGVHVFYPGKGVDTSAMTASLTNVFEGLQTFVHEEATIHEKAISLEEEMKSIVNRLVSAGNASLSGLSRDRSRGEVVVIFLAILHLVRDQLVNVEQKEHFSDILITSEHGNH